MSRERENRVHKGWRRFRPAPRLDGHVSADGLFGQVSQELHDIVQRMPVARWRRFDIGRLDHIIDEYRHKAELSGSAVDWLTALILQTPRAAIAQRKMDKSPHGHGAHARLYELIDFNDSFVSAVLALPEQSLPAFQTEVPLMMARFCARLRVPMFTDEQYEAITHGLSREIAVYRGAMQEGLEASMTSRSQDAKGVDMIVTDPLTERSVNIDVKTRSAYYYRLKDLRQEGRISAETAEQADFKGFCEVRNGHSADGVDVVLLWIDPEEVGEIVNFSFTDTKKLGAMLRLILREYGTVAQETVSLV